MDSPPNGPVRPDDDKLGGVGGHVDVALRVHHRRLVVEVGGLQARKVLLEVPPHPVGLACNVGCRRQLAVLRTIWLVHLVRPEVLATGLGERELEVADHNALDVAIPPNERPPSGTGDQHVGSYHGPGEEASCKLKLGEELAGGALNLEHVASVPTNEDAAVAAGGGGGPYDCLLVLEARFLICAARAPVVPNPKFGTPHKLARLCVVGDDNCWPLIARRILPSAGIGAHAKDHEQLLVGPNGRNDGHGVALVNDLLLPLLLASLQVKSPKGTLASPRLVPLLLRPQVGSRVDEARVLADDSAAS
mmetsp:Transcript_13202/g.36254  ORF Transcript_13202/g.36254 Transcript_13202/m.36254 type:complete len:305 (-) Transcript_13202:532-1446(-)